MTELRVVLALERVDERCGSAAFLYGKVRTWLQREARRRGGGVRFEVSVVVPVEASGWAEGVETVCGKEVEDLEPVR